MDKLKFVVKNLSVEDGKIISEMSHEQIELLNKIFYEKEYSNRYELLRSYIKNSPVSQFINSPTVKLDLYFVPDRAYMSPFRGDNERITIISEFEYFFEKYKKKDFYLVRTVNSQLELFDDSDMEDQIEDLDQFNKFLKTRYPRLNELLEVNQKIINNGNFYFTTSGIIKEYYELQSIFND